jgi:hypothetical protein
MQSAVDGDRAEAKPLGCPAQIALFKEGQQHFQASERDVFVERVVHGV